MQHDQKSLALVLLQWYGNTTEWIVKVVPNRKSERPMLFLKPQVLNYLGDLG